MTFYMKGIEATLEFFRILGGGCDIHKFTTPPPPPPTLRLRSSPNFLISSGKSEFTKVPAGYLS